MTRRYADPYLVGVGLGLVLLTAFVLTGRGLGASGAFNTVAAALVKAMGSGAANNAAFKPYVEGGILGEWLVWEIAGVFIGGLISALLAGRFALTVERGPRVTGRARIAAAVAGGALMGVGARFARGCTSGQALSGGAVLAVGAWVFIVTCFIAAFAFAPFVRKQWQ